MTPTSFADWCTKADLTMEQEITVRAVLSLTPQGTAALGNLSLCRDADTFLTAIPSLNLLNSNIKDVSPLGNLSHLTNLTLSGNRIEDVGPLFGLSHLQTFDVGNNQISNVAALGAFTGLKELNASRNQITDLRPLAALRQLEKLELGQNMISDVAPIGSLLTLQEVVLSHNQLLSEAIEDLTGLSALSLWIYPTTRLIQPII